MEEILLSLDKVNLLKLDTQLPSGRIYPTEEVDKALKTTVLLDQAGVYQLYGIMQDKYEDPNVDTRSIAFRVKKLFIEDKILYANLDVLNTPNGRILYALFENNVPVSFHTCFSGNTDSEGICGDLFLNYVFASLDEVNNL